MKFLNKVIALSMIILLGITNLSSFTVNAAYKLPFETASKVVYMINTDTNTVVYEKGAHEKIFPASLTKIMTAIVAIEAVSDLEGTVVTAPAYLYDEFYKMNVSTADIRQGEQVRMIDLLYGMILQSACEASSIIADYVGGGNITEFVELMNKKAKEIGAVNTTFENSHGLHNPAQQTTAYDMYLITKYAMTLPIFEKIATSPSYQMPATNKHAQPRFVTHTNNMLSKTRGGSYYYQYIKGIKTGTLPEVGKNMISVGSKDGYNYMLITIGAPMVNDKGEDLKENGAYVDAKKLYEWAFSSFKHQKVLNENDIMGETSVKLSSEQDYVTLLAKNDISALLPKESDVTTVQKVKHVQDNVRAPIKKGEVLGKMDLKLNDEVIATVDLIASQDVNRSMVLYSIDLCKRFLDNTLVKALLIILMILVLLYIVVNARYRKIKRMKAKRMRYNNHTK